MVYWTGNWLENYDYSNSIFVKNCKGDSFKGKCWPGESVWIDFLNENASNFWSSMYKYTSFKGTTKIYQFWNDMNEPSVFDSIQGTMPLSNYH